MWALAPLVTWHWRKGASIGINFAPVAFEAVESSSSAERREREIGDANIVVAMAGRMGTRSYCESLLSGAVSAFGSELGQKPLVMLSWFGGSIETLMRENKGRIIKQAAAYADLNPCDRIPDWFEGTMPEELASRLCFQLLRLISPK
jgi:hypothetical protein